MGGSCARRGGMLLLASLLLCGRPAVAGDWAGEGPQIGWIRDLLVATDGFLYAATFGGGIFRSEDGGRHWTEASSNVRDAVVIDLEQSPEFPSYIYAATSDRALLRRELGSNFWAALAGFPLGDRPPGLSLEVFPTRPTRVAFGTERGVYVSNSYGGTWPDSLSFSPGEQVNSLLVLPGLPNTIHAVTPFELLVTQDTGASIQYYSDGLAPITYLIDLEPWSSGNDSLLVTDQRGPVWQFVDRQRFESVGPVEAGAPSNKYFARIDPADPDRILVGSSAGLWTSPDRLQSWDLVADPQLTHQPEIWAVDDSRISATDSLRLGSFTLGFVRTGPGGALPWAMSNAGLTAAWARTIHARPGSALCGTAHGRLYRTPDEGASWEDVTGGLRTLQISVAHDTGTAWIVSGSTGVVRSVDGGQTWSAVALPGAVTRLNRVVESGTVLLAVTNAGLVRSDDDGQSFTAVAGVPSDRAGFALALAPSGQLAVGLDRVGPDPAQIAIGHPDSGFTLLDLPAGYQGAVRGLAFAGPDLVVGTNGFGGSPLYRLAGWAGPAAPEYSDLSAMVGDGSFEVRDVATRANAIALGTAGQGVFLSLDGGQSWQEWNGTLPTRRIESVDFAPSPSRSVLVATLGRGVFARPLDVGVPVMVSGLRAQADADGVEVRFRVAGPGPVRLERRSAQLGDRLLVEGPADGEVVAHDRLAPGADPHARVAWVVETWAGDGWVEAGRIERSVRDLVPPGVSRLLGAAPNPFNPSTRVHFELARAGRVRLEIFDARGRRVRQLVDRWLSAGPHSAGFDGRDEAGAALASGVYYVRVETEDEVLQGRITLLR